MNSKTQTRSCRFRVRTRQQLDRFGSVDGIVLRSSEDPRLGLKEILMRVLASSLNYRDLMVLKGGGRGPTKLGVVPLSDGAGEVAAIGQGVTRVKIGDRIASCFHPRWFGGPIKPDDLTDRLGANLDGMLGEIRGVERGSGCACARPSVLRGSRHPAMCRGDRLGSADGPSPGYRGRHRPDAAFGGSFGVCAAIRPDLGRSGDRDDLERGEAERLEALGVSEVINYTEIPDWTRRRAS